MISLDTAANFVKSYCLKDWTLDEIKHEIIKSVNNNTLIYTTDEQDNLLGICFGEEFKEEKRLHVKAIVATRRLPEYIKYFKKRFPGYIISCYRYGFFKILKL